MATSRGATPADPVLAATTDDNSRGGLFVRSNIANPVAGADAQGTTVGAGNITINASINGGTVVPVTFNVNEANDVTLPMALTVTIPDSGGPQTGGGDPVRSGRLTNSDTTIELTLDSGNTVDINIADLATQAELDAVQAMIPTIPNFPTTFLQLTDTPAALGSNNQVLGVSSGALTFIDQATAPQWEGNSGRGDNVGSNPVTPTRLVLDSSTGLVLSNSGGVLTIQAEGTAPAPAEAPTPQVPAPTSALSVPTESERTVTYRPQGSDTVTAIENIQVTRVVGNTRTTVPGATMNIDSGVGSVTIPETAATPPGDYEVQATVTTMSTDGMTEQTRETNTIDRFIPFYQNRAQPTAAAPGTASGAAWSGSLTAIAGTGQLFIAVLDGELPNNTASAMVGLFRPRVAPGSPASITLTLADSTTRNFDVFQVPANANQEVSDFRTTRR